MALQGFGGSLSIASSKASWPVMILVSSVAFSSNYTFQSALRDLPSTFFMTCVLIMTFIAAQVLNLGALAHC